MLTLSMLIFGSIGIFRRFIPLPSAALACYRGFCGAALMLLAARLRGRRINQPIGTKKVLALALTGAAMGFNWILLFEAYNHTTIATATLCYYMQPTIVMLLSPIVFGERLTAKKRICVLLSLVGMALVSGIAENGLPQLSEMKGVLFGLGAAVLYAMVVIMNKKLPGLDAWQKTIIQLLSAAVALVPYLLITRPSLGAAWTPAAVIMLIVVGVVHTGVAYLLYFGSMDGLKAQTVALLSYLDPVAAMLLAAVVLREHMSVYGIVGAVLIIGAALFSEVDFKKQH